LNDFSRIPVYGRDGRLGWIEKDPNLEKGEDIRVWQEDGASIWVPRNLIVEQEDGSYYLPISSDQIKPGTSAVEQTGEHRVIPVIVEEAKIGRRQTTSTVRFHKKVNEREELIDEPGFHEEVQVDRVEINRVIETPPEPRTEGNTLIIPVLEAVLVVEKRLILKEEVRITKRRETVHEPQKVKLRAESVEIERSDPEDAGV